MSEEKILTGAEILDAPDLSPVLVKCPEWGGSVFVRPLESWEQDDYECRVAEAKQNDQVMPAQFRARLALTGLCHRDGSPLFTDAQLKKLSKKSAAPINRIVKKILEISGMDGDAVERAEKNSAGAPGDSSGSNSATATESP
jgi:hypothetical protein